jgi:hypothetical protein
MPPFFLFLIGISGGQCFHVVFGFNFLLNFSLFVCLFFFWHLSAPALNKYVIKRWKLAKQKRGGFILESEKRGKQANAKMRLGSGSFVSSFCPFWMENAITQFSSIRNSLGHIFNFFI